MGHIPLSQFYNSVLSGKCLLGQRYCPTECAHGSSRAHGVQIYLTRFKTRRPDPEFDINKEIRDYEFCSSGYMTRCVLWAPDF